MLWLAELTSQPTNESTGLKRALRKVGGSARSLVMVVNVIRQKKIGKGMTVR